MNEQNPKELIKAAERHFEVGNFRKAQKLLKKVLKSEPKPDLKEKAQSILNKLGYDKVEFILGVVGLILLLSLYIGFGLLGK